MSKKFFRVLFFTGIGLLFSTVAHADVIFQLQPQNPSFDNNNDSSVTSFTNSFDDGNFNGSDRYFYQLDGVAPTIEESVSFASTTHTYDLDDVTWDFIEFSGAGAADDGTVSVELFVNTVSVGVQATPATGDGVFFQAGRLTWDLSSVDAGANFDLVFNIIELGGGDASFFELADDVATREGLTVNGTITAVPEPTSLGLLGLLATGLVVRRRR